MEDPDPPMFLGTSAPVGPGRAEDVVLSDLLSILLGFLMAELMAEPSFYFSCTDFL